MTSILLLYVQACGCESCFTILRENYKGRMFQKDISGFKEGKNQTNG